MRRPAELSSQSAIAAVILGLVWVVAFSGCATVEGSIKLSGGPLGERVLKADTCQSGVHHGFFGVDLYLNESSADHDQGEESGRYIEVNGAQRYLSDVADTSHPSRSLGTLKMRAASDMFHGPLVRLYDASFPGGYIEFTPAVCENLRVGAEDIGNKGSSMVGSIRMQCALANGTRAAGTITFEWCH
jgi:hypothetical protein